MVEGLNRNIYKLKGFICDQINLKDQSVTNLKLKGLICYKLKRSIV